MKSRALAAILVCGVLLADVYVLLFPLSIYGLQSDIPLLLMVMLGIGCVSYQFIEIDQIRENKTCAAMICTFLYIIKALLFAGYIICVLHSTTYANSIYETDGIIINHVNPAFVGNVSEEAGGDDWLAPVVFHWTDGRVETFKTAQIYTTDSYCLFPVVPSSYNSTKYVKDFVIQSLVVCVKEDYRTCADLVQNSRGSCYEAIRLKSMNSTIGVKLTYWKQQIHQIYGAGTLSTTIQQQLSPDFLIDKTDKHSPYIFTLYEYDEFYEELYSRLSKLLFFTTSYHLCYLVMYFLHVYSQQWLKEHFRSTVIFPDLEMQIVSNTGTSGSRGGNGTTGEGETSGGSGTEDSSSITSTREPSLDLSNVDVNIPSVNSLRPHFSVDNNQPKRLEDIPAEITLVSKTTL